MPLVKSRECLWKNDEHSLSFTPYSDMSDVFVCTYEWHKSQPDFLREWGKFNRNLKDSEGSTYKGWLIPYKRRDAFLEALCERAGGDAVSIPVPPTPAQRKIQPRVRAQAVSPEPGSVVDLVQGVMSAVERLVSEDKGLCEDIIDDRIYLSGPLSDVVSKEADKYSRSGWSIVMWSETECGAIAVLSK